MERALTHLHLTAGPAGWVQVQWRRGADSREHIAWVRFAHVQAELVRDENAQLGAVDGLWWHRTELHTLTPTQRHLQDIPLHKIKSLATPARCYATRSPTCSTSSHDLPAAFESTYKQVQRKRLKRPAGRKLGDDFYQEVAWTYRDAVIRGLDPGKTIAADTGAPASTVNRWIAAARDPARGYLPPTEPGRVERLMASVWITTRATKAGEPRYRVEYRLGGREAPTTYGGSFKTRREALARKAWLASEVAALHVPDLERVRRACRCADAAGSRGAVAGEPRRRRREATRIQHRSSLHALLRLIGDRRPRRLRRRRRRRPRSPSCARRASGRRSARCRAPLGDAARLRRRLPNPARDKLVGEAAVRAERRARAADGRPRRGGLRGCFPSRYRLPLLVLDATGMRLGETRGALLG